MNDLLRKFSDTEMVLLIILQNHVIFFVSILFGEIIYALFKAKKVSTKRELKLPEIRLAYFCVFNNIVITLIGFYLWKSGVIVIRDSSSFFENVLSFLIVFLVMDLAMYVLHRLAHWKAVYPYVHKSHHEFSEVRPVTLFALNPIETYGFGFLWLLILYMLSPTWIATIVYLTLNVIFGSLGHMSVEPFNKNFLKVPFLNQFTTTTFHSLHHEDIDSNYGFYTSIWDKLGKSLSRHYRETFEKRASLLDTAATLEVEVTKKKTTDI